MIWKYPIATARLSVLEIPEGAQLLHVAMQRGTVTLWYMVDPQALKETARYRICGNGVTRVHAQWLGQRILEELSR